MSIALFSAKQARDKKKEKETNSMGSLVINEKYKINSDQKHVERVFSSQNNSETYQIRSDHITSGSESDQITSINRQALVLQERRPSVSRFAPFSFSQPKRNLIETARI